MRLIWVFALFAASGEKEHSTVLFVDIFNLTDNPWSLRELPFELAGFAVEIKMIPTVALGCEDHFASRVIKAVERLPGINVLIRVLAQHDFLFAGFGSNRANFFGLEAALGVGVENCFAVGRPFNACAILTWQLDRRRLHV